MDRPLKDINKTLQELVYELRKIRKLIEDKKTDTEQEDQFKFIDHSYDYKPEEE